MSSVLVPQLRFPEFIDKWRMKMLGDVIDFKNGKPFEDYVDENGEYSLITIDSVSINGKLKNKFKKVTRSDNSLKKNDIVTVLSDIAHGELLGLTSLIPADNKFVLNQRMGRLRPREGASPSFLSHYINTRQLYYRKRGQGTSQRHIYERDINQMPINLPSICEQEKIADFLTAVDERIAASERKCGLLTCYKRGVMQQLFSQKIRFKKPDGSNYPNWQSKKFSEVFDEVTNKVGSREVETYSITAGKGFVSQTKKFGRDISGSQNERYTLLAENEFAYNKGNSKTYTYGCVYENKEGKPIAVPNVFISFKLKDDDMAQGFFGQLFINHYLDQYLRKIISSGARMDGLLNVNKADFFSIPIPVPTAEEQQKIADFLTTLDDRIAAERTKLTAAKQFKKALLQRMFV